MNSIIRPAAPAPGDDEVIALTRAWLAHAVIGLNLCPFASAVYRQQQIDFRVSHATDTDRLRADLRDALHSLATTDAQQTDTTLLIHPQVLNDFFTYNDFLEDADQLLVEVGLEGVLQIASFHPDYQFAGTDANDITNSTNRSPFPMLHLLREASLDRAIAAVPDTDRIIEHNLATLQQLGHAGWQTLSERIRQSALDSKLLPPASD